MNENDFQDGRSLPPKRPPSRKRRFVFISLLLTLTLTLCGALYFGSLAWRATALFRSISESGARQRWIGSFAVPDDRYAYQPRANALAYHSLSEGERIPARMDENGFRIPEGGRGAEEAGNPRILFLGDSFTYGYGVPAQETFSCLAAAEVGATCLNGGVPGWGLAQMEMRAQDLIPKLKPDIVVVQFSSWLLGRSMRHYAPMEDRKTAAPYFYETPEGRLAIHPPLFQSIRYAEGFWKYQEKGLVSFAWHAGIPTLARDDWESLRILVKSRLGAIPMPATSRQKVVDFAYSDMARLCAANGARMLILVLPNGINDPLKDNLDALPVPVVDTFPALAKNLHERAPEAWRSEYCLWRGDPPEVVDRHPNARMHKIIAAELAPAIHRLKDERTDRKPVAAAIDVQP